MEKLRKSFKSLSDIHNTNNINTNPEEERQILLTENVNNTNTSSLHTNPMMMSSSPSSSSSSSSTSSPISSDRKEQVIKIHDGEPPTPPPTNAANRMWRDSSYDFTNDPNLAMKEKDKAKANGNNANDNGGETNKYFDFITESASPLRSPLSIIAESPNNNDQISAKEVRVSFNENVATEPVRRRSNATGGGADEPDEVLVCSSSSSFRRKSSVLMTKQKSRLADPPEQDQHQHHQQQQKSRMLKSGMLGKSSEIDEDDPFLDDDLPDEYRKMKLFSPLTILQMLSLVSIVAGLVCTLTIKQLRKQKIFDLVLWKWELMVLVLICGRLVSGWGIRVIVFFIERNFLMRKRVVYFVYGLRNAVQNCVWLALVLIAWKCIFDEKMERMTNTKVLSYVTKIWVCLLVATFIWLLKTLLVKVLAMSFHVSAFFDRIQESLFNQYVIETLSGPPLMEIQQEQEEEENLMAEVQKLQNAGAKLPADLKANLLPKMIGTPRTPWKSPMSTNTKSPVFSRIMSKREQEETGISIDHLHRLNQKNISAWNMKRLMNTVRKGILSTLDEQLQESAGQDETAVQITSEKQAKAAAKRIFSNVAKPGSKYIFLEDLMRFLREGEAMKTMRLFEGGSENKGTNKRALKNWVVNVFRERRALALSLNDTKTAVNKLHHMLNGLVLVIILIIWLLILKIATTQTFLFLSSQILLVVFVFGNTCKTTFEAIVFLFVMHPYDVGDRIELDGVQMVVEEMNILTTVFLRYDNQKIIYPNSVLSTKPISNYYRSPDMGDAIDFCIHISTPMEKIVKMKERIIRYIESNSDHWYPAPMVVMRDVEDMNRVKYSVWPSHRMNFQDMGERWRRRAILVEEMVKIFRELDIEYRMLPRDVNVRNLPPLTSTRLPTNWTACI